MSTLELLDCFFGIRPEDTVLVDSQCTLQHRIVQALREAAGGLFQVAGSEKFCGPVGRVCSRACHIRDLLAFDILFWTGCREGEMLALLPKDLTDDDQLRIYKTYHRKKGQDILGPTKNSKKGGNRNVPIPHWLAEEFRTYCSKLYGLTPDDRVFYMTCTALNKELTRCTQITYLPDIRVHDLRHSHVSLCIELGYSIVLVAKRIGDTVPVVMRTYAHLYPNKQQELVSRLETLSTSSSSKDESDLMPLV